MLLLIMLLNMMNRLVMLLLLLNMKAELMTVRMVQPVG